MAKPKQPRLMAAKDTTPTWLRDLRRQYAEATSDLRKDAVEAILRGYDPQIIQRIYALRVKFLAAIAEAEAKHKDTP